jgi:cytochrome oxidase Cu insertion factor (SCO1/SenC/PrrC family)
MARRASIAQFALGTVAALACACAGGADDGRGGAAPAASSSSAVAAAPANAKVGRDVGNLAPDFEAKDVEGKAFRLSDYRGKVVLLDFWGFW